MLSALACLLFVPFAVLANTEKDIFLAPDVFYDTAPADDPFLPVCVQNSLSPSTRQLRTRLAVAFPEEQHPHGTESWYLLSGLEAGKRYEVRVCWVATVCAFECWPFSVKPWSF